MVFKIALAAAVGAMLAMTPANAAGFGPASASLSLIGPPSVTTGATTNTLTLTSGNSLALLSSGTGLFAGMIFQGAGLGTVSFNTVVGSTVIESVQKLFTFDDKAGGAYVFNVNSAETTSYSAGNSNSFSLYLLGSLGDSNLNLTPTPTSFALTFSNTNGSLYSLSGQLSNPPVPPVVAAVPEPASLALIGLGLATVLVMRSRAGKQFSSPV